jgi:hypothetical protein
LINFCTEMQTNCLFFYDLWLLSGIKGLKIR